MRRTCHNREAWSKEQDDHKNNNDFTEEEEDLIIRIHAVIGNRWPMIAGRLPGRTETEVENHWNCHLKKKLECMGIDPDNHRPNDHLRQQQRSFKRVPYRLISSSSQDTPSPPSSAAPSREKLKEEMN